MAINSENKLYMFILDTSNDVLTTLKVSEAVSTLSPYSQSGTLAKAAFAELFDYYLYGTASSLDFSGSSVSFTNKIGYVMGLEKNRVKALMVTTDLSALSFAAPTRPPQTINT